MYRWNDGTDYLMHHGIKGQKWGVQNGPPYPLDNIIHNNVVNIGKMSGKQAINKFFSELGKDPSTRSDHYTPYQKMMAVTKDCWNFEDLQKKARSGNEVAKKRIRDAASLGLSTLVAMGALDKNEVNDNFSSFAEWFIYEDQTIGCGMIADLINHGYTSDDIHRMMRVVEDADRTISMRLEYFRSEMSEEEQKKYANLSYEQPFFDLSEGYALVDFAKECEKVKNNK